MQRFTVPGDLIFRPLQESLTLQGLGHHDIFTQGSSLPLLTLGCGIAPLQGWRAHHRFEAIKFNARTSFDPHVITQP